MFTLTPHATKTLTWLVLIVAGPCGTCSADCPIPGPIPEPGGGIKISGLPCTVTLVDVNIQRTVTQGEYFGPTVNGQPSTVIWPLAVATNPPRMVTAV